MKPLKGIKEFAIKKTSKVVFSLKKNSPEILLAGSLLTGIGTVVFACKAAKKMDVILDEFKATKEDINDTYEKAKEEPTIDFDENKKNQTMLALYFKTCTKYAKLFAPAITLGAVTIAFNVSGHKIIKKRLIRTAAAYNVVSEGFDKMFKNVADKYGKEEAIALKHGVENKEFKKITDENESQDNKEVVTKKVSKEPGLYARFFDESSKHWKDNGDQNVLFVSSVETYYNKLLLIRGYVMLNEVYEALDIVPPESSFEVGWRRDAFEDGTGDGYISFGVYDIINKHAVNGYEPVFLLDFNIDNGVIHRRIINDKRKKK